MFYTATLICDPRRPVLTMAMARAATGFLPMGRLGPWLAPGVAIQSLFQLELDDPKLTEADKRGVLTELADEVRGELGGAPIDVVVQPDERQRKRLFLADMDSTMIEQECIDELADYVGLKGEVSAITERAMRGDIAFEPALRERVALLKGLPLSVVDEIIANAHHVDAGRAGAGAHHAGARRLLLPRLGRVHALHRPGRCPDRLR